MALMDAPVYGTFLEKKRHNIIIFVLGVAGIIAIIAMLTWNMSAERRVNQLFAAVEAKNFSQAFGIWNSDPTWLQHAQQYAGYPYGRFVSDWGPNSEYGVIHSHKILHATSRYGNSTLLVVEVNGRKAALLTLAVDKHAHAVYFSPFALTPAEIGFGWTDWRISYR